MQLEYTDIDPRTLIGHGEWVEADQSLDEVYKKLSRRQVDFVAVLEKGSLIGLCSRTEIGMLLGHRYGHPLYSRHPVRNYMLRSFLAVSAATPITEILTAAFQRDEASFYDDIALIDENGNFLGLIFMRTLVRLQNRFFLRTIESLEKKQAELNRKNQQRETELLLAHKLQQATLPQRYPCFPPHAPAHRSLLQFHHYYRSADLLGGDFFHIVPLSELSAGLYICDVVGHGVSSALITAMMRALVEGYRSLAEEPGQFLKESNQQFTRMLSEYPDAIFATAGYLTIDGARRTFKYASAGHPSPLLLNRTHNQPCRQLEEAREVVGLPLGILEQADYETLEGEVGEGDVFIVYTDGLYEVFNAQNEMFGQERLAKTLGRYADRSPPELFDAVISEVQNFSGRQSFEDDVCIVGVSVAK